MVRSAATPRHHSGSGVDSRKQSALPSATFVNLSPPDVSRHISTSLPAGTALAQVICGLLSYLVVANLHVAMQDASLASEFVIKMLANSSPGKIMQLTGTESAAAGSARPASATTRLIESTSRKPAE